MSEAEANGGVSGVNGNGDSQQQPEKPKRGRPRKKPPSIPADKLAALQSLASDPYVAEYFKNQAEQQAKRAARPPRKRPAPKPRELPPPAPRIRCGANNRGERKGTICNNFVVTGRTRCRMHGGRTPVGPGSQNRKKTNSGSGGMKYSKVLPKEMRENYERAAGDPELLSLRDDIALDDARVMEVLKRTYAGGGGDLWIELKGAWGTGLKSSLIDYKTAVGIGDAEQIARYEKQLNASVDAVDKIINAGERDEAAFAEVMKVTDHKASLIESELNRLKTMSQVMTAEEAYRYVSALIEAVRRHVTDEATLSAVALDFSQIIGLQKRLMTVDAASIEAAEYAERVATANDDEAEIDDEGDEDEDEEGDGYDDDELDQEDAYEEIGEESAEGAGEDADTKE